MAAEGGNQPEDCGPARDAPEPAREEQVERAAVDEEPDRREDGDDDGDHGHRAVERESRLWEEVRRLQRLP
jgi:hypothetical protein